MLFWYYDKKHSDWKHHGEKALSLAYQLQFTMEGNWSRNSRLSLKQKPWKCSSLCLFMFCYHSFFFYFLFDTGSLYIPGCPRTHCVACASLYGRGLPTSAFLLLGLKACVTMPSSVTFLTIQAQLPGDDATHRGQDISTLISNLKIPHRPIWWRQGISWGPSSRCQVEDQASYKKISVVGCSHHGCSWPGCQYQNAVPIGRGHPPIYASTYLRAQAIKMLAASFSLCPRPLQSPVSCKTSTLYFQINLLLCVPAHCTQEENEVYPKEGSRSLEQLVSRAEGSKVIASRASVSGAHIDDL